MKQLMYKYFQYAEGLVDFANKNNIELVSITNYPQIEGFYLFYYQ